jgi:hypothetical protein
VTFEYLTADDIIEFHRRLMLEEGQLSMLVAPDKLDAALLRPQTSVFLEMTPTRHWAKRRLRSWSRWSLPIHLWTATSG